MKNPSARHFQSTSGSSHVFPVEPPKFNGVALVETSGKIIVNMRSRFHKNHENEIPQEVFSEDPKVVAQSPRPFQAVRAPVRRSGEPVGEAASLLSCLPARALRLGNVRE
eukprot:2043430-Rhodomonas_salina.2